MGGDVLKRDVGCGKGSIQFGIVNTLRGFVQLNAFFQYVLHVVLSKIGKTLLGRSIKRLQYDQNVFDTSSSWFILSMFAFGVG